MNTDGAMDSLYIRVNSVQLDESASVPTVKDYLDLIAAGAATPACSEPTPLCRSRCGRLQRLIAAPA